MELEQIEELLKCVKVCRDQAECRRILFADGLTGMEEIVKDGGLCLTETSVDGSAGGKWPVLAVCFKPTDCEAMYFMYAIPPHLAHLAPELFIGIGEILKARFAPSNNWEIRALENFGRG